MIDPFQCGFVVVLTVTTVPLSNVRDKIPFASVAAPNGLPSALSYSSCHTDVLSSGQGMAVCHGPHP